MLGIASHKEDIIFFSRRSN